MAIACANTNNDQTTDTETTDKELKDISTVLENIIKHVGELGLYQRLLFLCMMPFGMAWSFVYFGQMFFTATPQNHWCRVPELEGLSVDLRKSLSIPFSGGEYDQCNMFIANYTHILETRLPPEAGTPTMPCGNGWEFLFEDIPYSTVVNEREWVCDRSYLVPWTQTIGFFGSIVGGILCGTLADRYGRLPVLILANLLGCIGGVGTIFTTEFWDFCICRFIVGMSCDSCFLMIYILVLEYIGTKYRSLVANMSIALYFGGGCLVMPWLALWVGNWKHFVLVTSAPMLLALAAPFVVPESTRWLVSKGRVDKAVQVLKKFEKINKSKIPDSVLEEFITIANKTKDEEEGVLTILKSPSLRLTLTFLIITFMGVAVVFDGIIRLSENLGLDFFVTFTVTSATEIPSLLILVLLLDRLGRRYMVMGPMLIAGTLSLIAAFVPRGAASVSLAVAARFFNNMSYGSVIQWTPELLPTNVRAAGASFVHVSSFAAVTLSPFIIYSDRLWEGLSLVLMGSLGIAVAGLALLVPETTGRRMPQTMDNWEELANTTRFGRKKTGQTAPKSNCKKQSISNFYSLE